MATVGVKGLVWHCHRNSHSHRQTSNCARWKAFTCVTDTMFVHGNHQLFLLPPDVALLPPLSVKPQPHSPAERCPPSSTALFCTIMCNYCTLIWAHSFVPKNLLFVGNQAARRASVRRNRCPGPD